jgi:hypothetical protein
VFIATATCPAGESSDTRLWLAALTLAALVLALAGGVVTYWNWRRLAGQWRFIRAEGRGRQEFLALVGIFISVIFILGIVWGGLPLLLLDVCEALL